MKKIIIISALILGIKVNAQIVGGFMPRNSANSFTVGNTKVNGTFSVSGAVTTPTVYGSSAAGGTLYLRGSSSSTPGLVSIGSSTASNFIVSGTTTLTGQTNQTSTLNIEGNTTWNTNQTNTLSTGNSGTVAVLSDAAFVIRFDPHTFNPADGGTYFFGGCSIMPTGNSNNGKITIPYNCTLVKWDYNAVNNGGNGTAESATISINGTTNYTLSSVINYTTAYTNFTSTAVSQNFNAGDIFNIKEVFPTFATNPLDVYQGLTLWFVRRQ